MTPVKPTPTLQDVAETLGMHKSTISLALSGKGNLAAETRTRIRKHAREMGYEPNLLAQRLAGGGNAPVCLFSGTLDAGLVTEKILRIQNALSERGLEAPLYTAPEDAQAALLRSLARQKPRAVVCCVARSSEEIFDVLENYQQRGGTVVCYDMPVPLACDQVVFDREDNAYQAARHLLKRGHRKLGLGMSSFPGGGGGERDPQAARLRGFHRALAEFDAPFRPEWLFLNPTYERGGAAMARQFLALSDRPTGLCIVNDYVALAFMTELLRAGVRLPEEVSVVGHDDQPIAAYCPVPLTSATQPIETLADAVVERLMARLEGDDSDPQTVLVRGELIERESVAPPFMVPGGQF